MTGRFIMPRAISFVMAAMVTWSMLAGIDTLATTSHAANELMAKAASAPASRL
jgi:hypothetical protein